MHVNLKREGGAVFPFAVLLVLKRHVLRVPPFPAGSCCHRRCFLMSLSAPFSLEHKAVVEVIECFPVLKAGKQTMPPSPFAFHAE